MKILLQKVVWLYANNKKFHSFVGYIEYAVIAFVIGYTGGIPATKDAWKALLCGLVGAAFGALKKWLVDNVQPPPQVQP